MCDVAHEVRVRVGEERHLVVGRKMKTNLKSVTREARVAFRLLDLVALPGYAFVCVRWREQYRGTIGPSASLGHDRNETTCVKRSLIDSESRMNPQVCGA